MRTCDECQVCCEQVAVVGLGKPSTTRCQHQCAGGCAIYSTRPSECAVYRCSWLEGYGAEQLRPDKSGLLLETATYGPLKLLFAMPSAPMPAGQRKSISKRLTQPGVVVFWLQAEELYCSNSDDEELAKHALWALVNHPVQMADGLVTLEELATRMPDES